jgi:hypothetical protein
MYDQVVPFNVHMHVQDPFTLLAVADIVKLQREVPESLERGMTPLSKEYSCIYVARPANEK